MYHSSTMFEQQIKLNILPQYAKVLKNYFRNCNVNLSTQKELLLLLLTRSKTGNIDTRFGICSNLESMGSICAYDFIAMFGGVLYHKNINNIHNDLDDDTIFDLLVTSYPIPIPKNRGLSIYGDNNILWSGVQLHYRVEFIRWIIRQIDIIINS